MIIIQLMGGLGNQLQQYALYRKFMELGADVRLDAAWFTEASPSAKRDFELSLFDGMEYRLCTDAEKKRLTGPALTTVAAKLGRRLFPGNRRIFTESAMYHPEILDFTDMYLSGYFACEKYYADILPLLRKEIRFKPSADVRNQDMAAQMDSCESVAIHYRRGDYLEPVNQELYGGICTDEYYQAAMDYVKERVPRAQFFLFSDDGDFLKSQSPDFVQESVGRGLAPAAGAIDWNTGKDSIYDMYLMSRCKHIICANSTFSFWGARLMENMDKIMIRPARHRNNLSAPPEVLLPLWSGWTLIDSGGSILK